MKLVIKTIPSADQRYETCGDYWLNPQTKEIHVRINTMSDEKAECAVLIHELVELFLCKFRNINWKCIDEFDMSYKRKHPNDEPGDNVHAPYHKEHVFATKIERQLLKQLGLSWKEYNKIINTSCKI